MNASSIACLKVTLDEVKPRVQRRIEVPLLIRLDRLHLVLQAPEKRPIAFARSPPAGKLRWRRARAHGMSRAAPTPWLARAARSTPNDGAEPQARDDKVNRPKAAINSLRTPMRSASVPALSSKAA